MHTKTVRQWKVSGVTDVRRRVARKSCEIQVPIVSQTCVPRDNGQKHTGSMTLFTTAFSPLLPYRSHVGALGRSLHATTASRAPAMGRVAIWRGVSTHLYLVYDRLNVDNVLLCERCRRRRRLRDDGGGNLRRDYDVGRGWLRLSYLYCRFGDGRVEAIPRRLGFHLCFRLLRH